MKFLKHIPGIILSAAIAFLACWIENILPIHLIGSAVIAMFIGMFLNHYLHNTTLFSDGLKFTSKKILKFAIILLGLSLNITTILHVGKMSLTVMIFTLLACFVGSVVVSGPFLPVCFSLIYFIPPLFCPSFPPSAHLAGRSDTPACHNQTRTDRAVPQWFPILLAIIT